jgi:hypothetical protein
MANPIEPQYKELQKKHQLPDFAVLDKEFEISTIEKPDFLLRNVRRKISERFDHATQLLDPLIQPDAGTFVHLTEYRALSESDRRNVLKLFQDIQSLALACIDAEMSVDDAQDVLIINRAAQQWPAIRAALRPHIQKIAAAWTNSVEHKQDVEYFG